MCEHEKKNCPHCNSIFECKVGSVLLCQCSTVSLTDDERMFIKDHYEDCLCASCMMEFRSRYQEARLEDQISQLVNSI